VKEEGLEEASLALSKALGIHPILASILISRGIKREADARKFLFSGTEALYDPFLIPGMEEAVEAIFGAIRDGRRIVVYGDYDVDGITALALMLSGIRELGGDAGFYIPDRMEEGYGLNEGAIRRIAGEGCGLLITVDCGVNAKEEIAMARKLGMDVVVTDHHEFSDAPPATSFIHPHNGPFPYLSGVGIAFKLLQALFIRRYGDIPGLLLSYKYLDLVALGTIGDIVPLVEENRVMAKYGLEMMGDRNGISALMEVGGVRKERMNSWKVSFLLAPRINAAGRIGDPSVALSLLLSDSKEEAIELAKRCEVWNRRRQEMEEDLLLSASQMVDPSDPAIVVWGDGWHPGIIGLVASRLVESYGVPAFVISVDREGMGRGSARGVPGISIHKMLSQCSDILIRFGGHEVAGGFSIDLKKIPEFKRRILSIVDTGKMGGNGMAEPEMEIPLRLIDIRLCEDLSLLEPHGPGNPRPLFKRRGVQIVGYPRVVGKNHLKLKLRDPDGNSLLDAIWFGMGDLAGRVRTGMFLDVTFHIGANEYMGKRSPQLEITRIDGG
jgi:single-stranded-DNA-specific exonuclease